MNQKTRKRGFLASGKGVKKLKQAKANKDYTYQKIAEEAHVGIDSVKRLFNPDWEVNVGEETIQAIANILDLDPGDVVEGWYPPTDTFESKMTNSEAAAKLLNNPRQVCQEILNQRLTINPLTNKDGTTFNYRDVCISLGLMERKKQRKIHKNFPTDREYNEYEVTRNFAQKEFFTEVIAQGNSPKSQGRKIAIIGEPGAGKTTRLQTIADWIFAQTEDVAIWISLADLKEKTIEEYLLKVWLKDALKVRRVTSDMEDALVELFNQGRVWLLLDGVDEMGVKNPLKFINSQISGWVASARIILTCRLNVWDVSKNYLESFDVYRNLDFDSEQVKEFIGKWFVKNSELGKKLQNELERLGKERIRDLIKNPLRLTLLCWFWQRKQGSFPETKAGLYQRFVEVFYEWKEWEPDPFTTKSEAKENLKVALGKLAVKAIDKNSSRFRLSHREVCEVLGNVDTSLFKLVIKLGWLNKVGVAEENPDEEVYAFFHPTFQEYFAAINISDRYFFLNHIPENPNMGTYRIFESQWKEVFLLWLGRDDVEKGEKEELIKTLVEFDDGCGNFYSYRAYFLAASGIAEFKECTIAKVIVKKVVLFYLNKHILSDVHELTTQTLLETDYTIASNLLTSLFNKSDSLQMCLDVAHILIKLQANTEKVTSILTKIMESYKGDLVMETFSLLSCVDAASLLIEIPANIEKIVVAMTDIMETYHNDWVEGLTAENAAVVLLEIYPENVRAKEIILTSCEYQVDKYQILEKYLRSLYLKNSLIIDNLVMDLCHSQDNNYCLKVCQKLAEMNICSSLTLNTLINLLSSDLEKNLPSYSIDDRDEFTIRSLIVDFLGEIGRRGLNNPDVINYLIELTDEKKWSSNIPEIEADDQTKSSNLKSRENPFKIKSSKDVTEGKIISRQISVIKSLGNIGYNNKNAIDALTQIIHSKRYIKIRYQAAISLRKIDPGNQEIIPLLTHFVLINKGTKRSQISKYTYMLKAAKNILIEELDSNFFQNIATRSRGFLVDFLSQINSNIFDKYRVNDIVWHCAKNMTYPDFYHTWHSNNSTIQNLENQIANISKQLSPNTKTYPIFIDAFPLKDETDTEAIAQEIYYQIHQTIYPNDENIPEIKNAPQLKRLIPKIKNHLNTKHLALILQKSDPHPETIAFCHKLTNALPIGWLTDLPLEPPLRGFPPNQPNLKSALETWLNEIDD